jgi:hypothetical protein
MKLVKASDIAMLSMTLDWKGNLKLIGSCLLGAVLFFTGVLVLMVLLAVGLAVAVVVVGIPMALTANALLFYYDDTGWKMAIIGVICFAGAGFFGYARDQKPRLFFDILARGAFWLLLGIALVFGAVGFTYLTETYGRLTVFGVLALFPLTCAFLSYWWHRKDKKLKNAENDTGPEE